MKRPLIFAAVAALLAISCSTGTSYYFDSENGNDANSGTSPRKPFRSFAKVAELELGPGDRILLKSGAVFTEKLQVSARGEEGRPVVIGRYGGEAYPHIKGDASSLEMLHIYNSEHIIVRDIEVSNKGARIRPHLSGVLVEAYNYGRAADITLDNLYVHDVYGSLIKGEGMEHEDAGGGQAMFITCRRDDGTDTIPSYFDGLIVENCHIKDCQRNGIIMWGNWARNMWLPSLGVVIRNNLLEGVPGDGIVPTACDGALVEYNIMRDCPPTLPYTEACDGIWPFSSDNTLVQFNVVEGHKSKTDGYGYDSDYNSRNSTFRYNLCSNCEGGFLLLCNSGGWPEDWSVGNVGTRVMYNVSINDGIRDFIVTENKSDYFSPVIHITGPTYNSIINKNIFIQPSRGGKKMDRRIVCSDDWRGWSDSTAFRDNYIYVEEPTVAYDSLLSTRNYLSSNMFWGPLVPQQGFVPGEGGFGRESWYDASDPNWDKLITFLEDKTVELDGARVPVLELPGFGPRQLSCSVRVDPGETVSVPSPHPVGINVDFLMDGGRYPDATHSLQEALAGMGVRYLRYPGGEKSDLYQFAAEPYTDGSHPTVCRTVLAPEDYPGMIDADGNFTYEPLDFDSYITLCRAIGAEPVVVVAADRYLIPSQPGRRMADRSKLIEHAAAWVRYANIQKGYGVKYWMIGNESWNNNNVNSNASIYAADVVDFSKAMKAVDPSIFIVANGEKDDFFRTVIQQAGEHIDRLCVSNYGVYDFTEGYRSYEKQEKCLVWPEQEAVRAIHSYAPADSGLKLIVSEYGTIDWYRNWPGTNDMGHAIVNFDMTGQLLQEPLLEFACFWNTRWIDNETECSDHDALDKDGNLTPTGMSVKLWNDYIGNRVVACESERPLVAYASVSEAGDRLYLGIVNKGGREVNASLELMEGYSCARLIRAEEYYGTSPEDTRPVLASRDESSPLKPYSISVFEYSIR